MALKLLKIRYGHRESAQSWMIYVFSDSGFACLGTIQPDPHKSGKYIFFPGYPRISVDLESSRLREIADLLDEINSGRNPVMTLSKGEVADFLTQCDEVRLGTHQVNDNEGTSK